MIFNKSFVSVREFLYFYSNTKEHLTIFMYKEKRKVRISFYFVQIQFMFYLTHFRYGQQMGLIQYFTDITNLFFFGNQTINDIVGKILFTRFECNDNNIQKIQPLSYFLWILHYIQFKLYLKLHKL